MVLRGGQVCTQAGTLTWKEAPDALVASPSSCEQGQNSSLICGFPFGERILAATIAWPWRLAAPQRGVAPSRAWPPAPRDMTHSRGSMEGDATEHLFF